MINRISDYLNEIKTEYTVDPNASMFIEYGVLKIPLKRLIKRDFEYYINKSGIIVSSPLHYWNSEDKQTIIRLFNYVVCNLGLNFEYSLVLVKNKIQNEDYKRICDICPNDFLKAITKINIDIDIKF